MANSEGSQIALPSGYRLEGYRIEAILGHGGFGITYRAVDEDLQQVVAIKEYLPREVAFRNSGSTVSPLSESERDTFEWGLERFLDEARTLARFRHPNIVGVRRFVRANDTAYLIMDYCEGDSLENLLAREGTLSPERVEAMLTPLLDALEMLHKVGVTHRDVKPGNIYLREDGSPVLLDFGAARQALAQHSRSVTAMATPGFAAFEHYSTKGKQGPWTDIHGLGATLYRCVTGLRPPDASDRMLEDELVPAEQAASGRYSKRLLRQIDAALKLRPQDRPQSLEQWSRFGLDVGVQERRRAVLSSPQGAVVTQRRDPDSDNPSGLITDRYRVKGEHGEIIEDTVTDLQWQRYSLGQTCNGRTCVGDAHRYTWDEAQQAANCVPGWRLPTIEELRTLVYCSSGPPTRASATASPCKGNFQRPTLDPEAFQNAPSSYFWSGSSGANDSYRRVGRAFLPWLVPRQPPE